jgi:hypothetical protein
MSAVRNANALDLEMVVDLDERGSFRAHVQNQRGSTVFEFSNEDPETGWPCEDGLWLVECGYMQHDRDTEGLLSYLKEVGLAKSAASLRLMH